MGKGKLSINFLSIGRGNISNYKNFNLKKYFLCHANQGFAFLFGKKMVIDEIWCLVANSWIKFAGGTSQAFANRNEQDFKNIAKKICFIVFKKVTY